MTDSPSIPASNAYGVVIVAAGFVALSIASLVGLFAYPTLQEAILTERGWTLTQGSRGLMVWGLVGAVASPIFGRLMDTAGVRPVMVFGIIVQLIATFLISRVNELWQLYLLFGMSSVGAMCTTYIPVATIIAHWFEKNRGAATGIAMLGLGVGGVVATVLSEQLLATMSWREVYAIYAGLLILAVPLIALLRLPRDHEGEPAQHDSEAALEEATGGLTLKESLRTRSFWGIGVGDAITGIIVAMLNVHLLILLSYNGFESSTAGLVYITFQLCIAFFTIVFGAIADHVSLRALAIACYGIPALSLFLLVSDSVVLAFAFAVICGACFGGRTAIFPLMLVHSFGPAHVGAIYGLSNSLFLIANGIGPVIGGEVYDRTGSTAAVYVTASVILVVSTVLVALMRNERATAA